MSGSLKLPPNSPNLRKNSIGQEVSTGNLSDVFYTSYDLDFFANCLCDTKNKKLTQTQKDAEQEFILQNIVKGAIKEARELARKYSLSIVIRPTSNAAHMSNESGSPTKPQEIKNKTSKHEDMILTLNLIKKEDVGAVVHYNPSRAFLASKEFFFKQFKDRLWDEKLKQIKHLMKEGDCERRLRSTFESRALEFFEEDPHYQPGGKFSSYVYVETPFLYLKARPGEKIFGDHDLFCLADFNGKEPLPEEKMDLLAELQKTFRFQAQHGCHLYWKPDKAFDLNIKKVIMDNHSILGGAPLIVVTPEYVKLCFFQANSNSPNDLGQLISVWDNNLKALAKSLSKKNSDDETKLNMSAHKWLLETYSGKQWLEETKPEFYRRWLKSK